MTSSILSTDITPDLVEAADLFGATPETREPVSRATIETFLFRLMEATNLSVTTKLVGLALLLQFYDPDTGQCNPSARAICNAANLSNKTVFCAIANLKSAGWITVESSQGGSPSHTNKYGFNFDRVAKPASPAARVPA
jgi:Helix-turn-helix domain